MAAALHEWGRENRIEVHDYSALALPLAGFELVGNFYMQRFVATVLTDKSLSKKTITRAAQMLLSTIVSAQHLLTGTLQ